MTESAAHVRVIEETSAYWRVVFENPPFNIVDATIFEGLQDLLARMDASPSLRVVVFESANSEFYLAHFDLTGNMGNITTAVGPTGLPILMDTFVRLTKSPVVSIAKIRGCEESHKPSLVAIRRPATRRPQRVSDRADVARSAAANPSSVKGRTPTGRRLREAVACAARHAPRDVIIVWRSAASPNWQINRANHHNIQTVPTKKRSIPRRSRQTTSKVGWATANIAPARCQSYA